MSSLSQSEDEEQDWAARVPDWTPWTAGRPVGGVPTGKTKRVARPRGRPQASQYLTCKIPHDPRDRARRTNIISMPSLSSVVHHVSAPGS